MITYNREAKTWKLDTPHTSYVMGLVDGKYLAHIYYGASISDGNLTYLVRANENPFVPSQNPAEKQGFLDVCPMEYPACGTGDFRQGAISVENVCGQEGLELVYKCQMIVAGKPPIPGLPASFDTKAGDEKQASSCDTLVITLEDPLLGVEVDVLYTPFDDVDVIARSVVVRNKGREPLHLTRVLSACLDVGGEGGEELLTLYGTWAREHQIERRPVTHGGEVVEALRGESGHDSQPFMALLSEHASYESGRVYALQLVYSGDLMGHVKENAFDSIRMVMGIHPEHFAWKLMPGEAFYAPEAVLTFSDQGLGNMSRTLHDFDRTHLIRSKWKFAKRPVLINNWEATYFDFTAEKLLQIAQEASKAGIDMLVCDDGWFGHNRNQPSGSLGDWFVNEAKMEGGLAHLDAELRKLHMRLGLWFEPEMISVDSDLYRAHPDWVLQLKGRTPSLCRDQYVLDFSNPAVIRYLIDSIEKVLRSAPIAYIKWDMNRPLSDVGSNYLPADQQKEIWHRHVLGIYKIQETLLCDFPDLLIENCSSGGARFDAGMLYYSPQIWCSDDMDPIERAMIHEGTELIYPVSAMGSHICKTPNDITGRNVPFRTRAFSAMIGTFGYELDITKLPGEERALIREQVAFYKKVMQPLVLEGDYYRLESLRINGAFDAQMLVSKNKREAVVFFLQGLARPNTKSRLLRLQGLDPLRNYRIEEVKFGSDSEGNSSDWMDGPVLGGMDGAVLTGDTLMHAGILIEHARIDFWSTMVHLKS